MRDNVKKLVLLIGVGNMGIEYAKVLKALNVGVIAVGNGEEGAQKFENATGLPVIRGGIDEYIKGYELVKDKPDFAIIAVPIEILDTTAIKVMGIGVKNILLEKPGALTFDRIFEVQKISKNTSSNVYIAYNRRYYSSAINARKMIEEDGGVKSYNFEFTEWKSAIDLQTDSVKQNMFYANSTHVVDMAFYLGGEPNRITCFCGGDKSWHSFGTMFSGAGTTKDGVLFSYQANWNAPGRWRVEILTEKRRFIFAPMEKLQVQKINSIAVNYEDIDDSLDIEYKPGMFLQVKEFLENAKNSELCTIEEHCRHTEIYKKMMCIE